MEKIQTAMNVTRRDFLRSSAAGAALSAVPAGVEAQTAASSNHQGMPYRMFGNTGERVSILGLGGHHIGRPATLAESIRLTRTAIDEGINFLDNAWDYHDGKSEEWMGEALQDGYRAKVFLMTKVCARDADGAMRQIEDSLRRLKTDRIDLLQFHECLYDNDPEMIFAPNGAIHAVVKAREQGKVRFIGFTGHKSPHIHLKMLQQDFVWDALQMPLNVMDAHYRSFEKQIIPIANARGIGVIAMKTAAGGVIPNSGLVTVAECLRYVLSLEIPVLVSGMATLEHLQQNLAVAKNFTPMSDAERRDILARVQTVAGDGRYEPFKSTQRFDSGLHRQQHGFSTQS